MNLLQYIMEKDNWWGFSIRNTNIATKNNEGHLLQKSSTLAEQKVRGSIPGLAATISDINYLLGPSCDIAENEISLKRRKSTKQQQTMHK